MTSLMKIAVGIATVGRPDILAETLWRLGGQIRRPDAVFVCPASPADFYAEKTQGVPYELRQVAGRRGLCAQRNAILEAARGFDVIAFFDDDFFASRDFLKELERLFAEEPDVVAASGRVLADGVLGPGLAVGAAQAILVDHETRARVRDRVDQYAAYGCNMSFRLKPIHERGLRFDEDLPLYGWLEDIDFCRRVAQCGRIVKNHAMTGVHLGHKGGRSKGVPLGYSQIANPIYMCRKGTYRVDHALRMMSKNFAANCGKLFWPEPWVDRKGRLKGNLLALADLLRGRLDPRKVVQLTVKAR
ncbi:glycosyltransferase family 2 protein [Methylocella sp.]|uniref:glycosyltransferase family 2 protein n=1 Tax=Methylocella sp. TaxID=1978226 RepID=UPI00378335B5